MLPSVAVEPVFPGAFVAVGPVFPGAICRLVFFDPAVLKMLNNLGELEALEPGSEQLNPAEALGAVVGQLIPSAGLGAMGPWVPRPAGLVEGLLAPSGTGW